MEEIGVSILRTRAEWSNRRLIRFFPSTVRADEQLPIGATEENKRLFGGNTFGGKFVAGIEKDRIEIIGTFDAVTVSRQSDADETAEKNASDVSHIGNLPDF